MATLLPLLQYHCLHTALSLAFHFQADVTDSFFLCWPTCWAPHLNVNDLFVCLLSAFVQHLIIGTVVQQSQCVNEIIMQYNTVKGSFGQVNYCASECSYANCTLNLDMVVFCRTKRSGAPPVCLPQLKTCKLGKFEAVRSDCLYASVRLTPSQLSFPAFCWVRFQLIHDLE